MNARPIGGVRGGGSGLVFPKIEEHRKDRNGLFSGECFGTARPGINRVRFRIFDLCSFPCRVGVPPSMTPGLISRAPFSP